MGSEAEQEREQLEQTPYRPSDDTGGFLLLTFANSFLICSTADLLIKIEWQHEPKTRIHPLPIPTNSDTALCIPECVLQITMFLLLNKLIVFGSV